MFEHIVPCGIRDRGVTSMARGARSTASRCASRRPRGRALRARRSRYADVDRHDVAWQRGPGPRRSDGRHVRSRSSREAAGVDARPGPDGRRVPASSKRLVRDHDLHTVCEEAGCPNIYECWSDRTATFMILGDRCTRACGFCLVDTRKPLAVDDRRAPTGRRRDRDARARARGDHVRRARRPPRRRRVGVRGDRRRGPGDEPRHRGRAADLRLQGRRGVAADDLRCRAPMC